MTITPADPCVMVIFGATGDLTLRLVMPALYNLARTKVLPENFALIGIARAEQATEAWRASLHDRLQSFVGNPAASFNIESIDQPAWDWLAGRMRYIAGDLTQPELYGRLGAALTETDAARHCAGNVLYYLAVEDRLFDAVVEQLGAAGLTLQKPAPDGALSAWRRVVIEKPFGHDLESSRALNHKLLLSLAEEQIFRIDHFLGKDTVQNILALRFANGLFEPIWNRDRIDHVQITVAETEGVGQRGSFYEATGALRDMIPNHIFTLLSMVAMEPPVGFGATAIRAKKADLFTAMPAIDPSHAVRGQYAAGTVLGKAVQGYRQEAKIAADSSVETFVAVRIEINNWRWAGVPFYARTGKRLAAMTSEVAICFKQAPYAAFQDTPVACLQPNWLVLHIAPDQGLSLQFEVKRPGQLMDLAAVKMEFHYDDWFAKAPNTGYETLLHDVMCGDQTLFMRADMVEQSWRLVQPLLDSWAADSTAIPLYEAGSDGPGPADDLLAGDAGRRWRKLAPAR